MENNPSQVTFGNEMPTPDLSGLSECPPFISPLSPHKVPYRREVFVDAPVEQVVVAGPGDGEDVLLLGSEAVVHFPGLLHRRQGIHFSVDYQGRHTDGGHLCPIAGFQRFRRGRVHPVAEIAEDGASAFDDYALQRAFGAAGRQFKGGVTAHRAAHHVEVARELPGLQDSANLLPHLVGVGQHGAEGGEAAAVAVAPIVGHEEVDSYLVINRGDVIVVCGRFTVAVEEEDGGLAPADGKEAAGEADIIGDGHRKVLGAGGRGRPVAPGIEGVHGDLGPVQRRVVCCRHTSLFSPNLHGWTG